LAQEWVGVDFVRERYASKANPKSKSTAKAAGLKTPFGRLRICDRRYV
jgi:hypothetical protein